MRNGIFIVVDGVEVVKYASFKKDFDKSVANARYEANIISDFINA
jgi:hypothetical protein